MPQNRFYSNWHNWLMDKCFKRKWFELIVRRLSPLARIRSADLMGPSR